MSIELRREYLNSIRNRYKNAPKREKKLILNEFCVNCGYSRKYAIRILNGTQEPRITKPGPKPKYGPEVVEELKLLWNDMGRMCSKKLKAAMPLWLPYRSNLERKTRDLLLTMSAVTIDRLLKPHRKLFERRGLSTTVPAVKHKIPIKLLDSEVTHPGYLEADTVAHCGDSITGAYIHSVTITELYSGWTENRATWTKEAQGVLACIRNIERILPFTVQGFACDNGTEFLNESLYEYWTKRLVPVDFVRRRPYKKNDSAHVEQKNYTHVRSLLGYERLSDPELVFLINEIYQAYSNPIWNFFTPVMKLVSKVRVGSKIVKKYDQPKTPYQRLLECDQLPAYYKKKLREKMEGKNPFYLKHELDKKIKLLFQKVENLKRKTLA